MRTTLRLVTLALLLAAGAALAGCPDNDPKPPTSPASSASATGSADPAPTTGSTGTGW